MKAWRWIWAGTLLMAVPGCGGGRLVPEDISVLLRSDAGRLALKAAEGHGGIWRWRARTYAQFEHVLLVTAAGADTAITNRNRDTTITPTVDTLANVRELCIFDLATGRRFARSASAMPSLLSGYNGDSAWSTRDGVPDSARVRDEIASRLRDTWHTFSLPFLLIDTTLRLSLVGDLQMVDTNITKGKEPGTFDTTIAPYTCSRLRVEWAAGRAPGDWMVFYVDGRDGRVRRTLSPVRSDGRPGHELSVWADVSDAVGLLVGGRRLGYPATPEGQITGPWYSDRRMYNVEFPRQLDSEPFDGAPARAAGMPASTGGGS